MREYTGTCAIVNITNNVSVLYRCGILQHRDSFLGADSPLSNIRVIPHSLLRRAQCALQGNRSVSFTHQPENVLQCSYCMLWSCKVRIG